VQIAQIKYNKTPQKAIQFVNFYMLNSLLFLYYSRYHFWLSLGYHFYHLKRNKIIEKVYFKNGKDEVVTIEAAALHRCVKGSRFAGALDNDYIVFPYDKDCRSGQDEYVYIGTKQAQGFGVDFAGCDADKGTQGASA